MKGRCLQPKHRDFARYGGRGITIDPRWLGKDGFVNFLADMGERPDGLTLDRIDNDGNYTPANCRWTTQREQRANRPQTRGWHRHAVQPPAFGWKTIKCLDCDQTATVRSVVTRWRCPEHRAAAGRANSARYRAKQHVSSC